MEQTRILYINNMVCDRCIMTVEQLLNINKISFSKVELNKAHLKQDIEIEKELKLANDLKKVGFELINENTKQLVSEIKAFIIEFINENSALENHANWSVLIADKFKLNYTYLSRLFSNFEGNSIVRFATIQRVEVAKNHLRDDKLSLTEIAELLGYKNQSHFSNQFKTVTRITPLQYRRQFIKRPV